jgi:hypothetical protein
LPKLPYIILGILLALGWIAWSIWPNYRQQRSIAQQLTKATESPADNPHRKKKAVEPPPESTFPLNAPGHDIRTDLKLVGETIETFRSNFPHDGNPAGSNAEITAALTGKNKLRFAFIPPTHPAINRDGELCDRWGTPFFFHAESATRMEVRSAGPDRKMWTEDDVAFAP